jgi:DNA-binding LacI/PurR family transcriptional regulator
MPFLKKDTGFVYDKLEQEIQEQILGGKLKAGDCILSESRLCEHYGISRRSVRTAIDNLIAKGLLYKKQGKGCFVVSLKSGTGMKLAKYSIALIIPDISDIFILTLCEGIQHAANRMNCNLVIKTSNGDVNRENQNIHYSLQQQEDGVIIFPNSGRANLDALLRLNDAGIPFVLIDRKFDDLDANFVGVDNVNGGYLATEHLIKLGHRKIAHLYGSKGSANDGRLQGFRKAMSDHGISCDENMIRCFEHLNIISSENRFEPDMEGGYENMKFLLRRKTPPTAIFAGNDYQAIGAIRAIHEAGLKVPDDISVVGFDDLKINPLLKIPLTTVHQPQHEIGQTALALLIQKIEELRAGKHTETIQRLLPVYLHERESSALIKK